LKQVTPITHDTAVYRFDLPEGHTGNLPVASCVIVKHQPAEGKPIIRPYTPTSPQEVSKL
jgi:cytochrome-b5 reductase